MDAPETGTPAAASAAAPPSERTRVRRRAQRGRYDRETVHAILDEGLVCHLAFAPDGQPCVLPTAYARAGDTLYLHGSPANRMLRHLAGGLPVCVAVTLLDGVVLARSAFHHSMNYRSVVVFGTARVVTEAGEKARAMRALVEHVAPGRSRDARAASAAELAQTLVLALPLDEASAKVRSGPPIDAEEDLGFACWAGVVPLRLAPGAPVADPGLPPGLVAPGYARRYRRPGA